jgi:DNA-directed RNA polymerase specialized sigma subunit
MEENIINMARKIVSTVRSTDVERDDLQQAALLGILEAKERWTEDAGCSFTTMAWRYAYNEINKLIYRQTTRNGQPLRVNRDKEIPKGLLFSEGESQDYTSSDRLVAEVFVLAEDVLSRDELYMFKRLYKHGDRDAVADYMEKYEVSQRTANRKKHKVREIMQEVLKHVDIN